VCGTWSVTLTERYGVMMYAKRVLSRAFGPERDTVTETDSEELNRPGHQTLLRSSTVLVTRHC
jgi:hypothetical protein